MFAGSNYLIKVLRKILTEIHYHIKKIPLPFVVCCDLVHRLLVLLQIGNEGEGLSALFAHVVRDLEVHVALVPYQTRRFGEGRPAVLALVTVVPAFQFDRVFAPESTLRIHIHILGQEISILKNCMT